MQTELALSLDDQIKQTNGDRALYLSLPTRKCESEPFYPCVDWKVKYSLSAATEVTICEERPII